MNIQKIKIGDLKPAEYNPRKDLKAGDAEFEKIRKSIENFGFVEPIIVNSDMTIIGGHQRYKVLKDLGYEEIECSVVDIDKTKEKALNIALNKISGEWDDDKLQKLLEELKATDIDIELTGFDFDEMLEDVADSKEDEFDIEEAAENIKEPKTKIGDVWMLGEHRLMCGDSTNQEDVAKLIDGKSIDMLITDPPYDMAMGGEGCFKENLKNLKI